MKDITGKRFGRLVATKRVGSTRWGCSTWCCKCDCGKSTEVSLTHLLTRATRSCGCLQRESNSKNGKRTGGQRKGPSSNLFRHGLSRSRTYTSWLAMKKRCGDRSRKHYGGRGIKVCLRWRKSFVAFLFDVGERPKGKTLDRWPNRNGNYEPGNVRWATGREQARNRNPRKVE